MKQFLLSGKFPFNEIWISTSNIYRWYVFSFSGICFRHRIGSSVAFLFRDEFPCWRPLATRWPVQSCSTSYLSAARVILLHCLVDSNAQHAALSTMLLMELAEGWSPGRRHCSRHFIRCSPLRPHLVSYKAAIMGNSPSLLKPRRWISNQRVPNCGGNLFQNNF